MFQNIDEMMNLDSSLLTLIEFFESIYKIRKANFSLSFLKFHLYSIKIVCFSQIFQSL
jgi:hypothetical protein